MNKDDDTSKQTPVLTFEHPFKIEVYLPKFEPLGTINILDTQLLAKGEHKVEIGYLNGGCSKTLLFALINNGMVVGVEAEGCEDRRKEPSEEIKSLFAEVIEKLDLNDKWEPIRVDDFIAMVQGGDYPPRAGTGAGCFYICIWHYCLFCCLKTATSSGPTCWIERRKPDVIM